MSVAFWSSHVGVLILEFAYLGSHGLSPHSLIEMSGDRLMGKSTAHGKREVVSEKLVSR